MLKTNYLKTKLSKGDVVLGTWITIPSVINTDIICSTGIDFIIIDFEHGPISFETAQEMIIAAECNNVSPIIRVSNNIQGEILKSLDIGAHGIQLPNLESIEQLHKLVEYSKYPPIGNRGFSPYTRAGGYNHHNAKPLIERSNSNILTIINIESKASIDNIEYFLENENLDILFIGLFDLSKSLGIPGDINNPMMFKYLEEVVTKAKKKEKVIGTIATSLENLDRLTKLGVKYLVYLVDNMMILNSYKEIVSSFKEINNE